MSEPITWSSMTPEQRDLLIAQKVMGWTATECDGVLHKVDSSWECGRCGLSGNWSSGDFDRFAGHLALPPRYSQSMDAAWQIVEQIMPKSRQAMLDGAYARFVGWFAHADLWAMTSQEAAQSICIAALRAKGYAVEE